MPVTIASDVSLEVPNHQPKLDEGEVHAWICDLGAVDAGMPALLSAGEREALRRYVRERDQLAYLRRRLIRRLVISTYTEVSACELGFESTCAICGSTSHGKPRLSVVELTDLEFSCSHSSETAVVAVGRKQALGADIEKIDRTHPVDDLLAFTSDRDERDRFEAHTEKDKVASFYALWTLKEAYLKAIGVGLSQDLATLAVEFEKGRPAALADRTPKRPRGWRVVLAPLRDYCIAVSHQVDAVRWFSGARLLSSLTSSWGSR